MTDAGKISAKIAQSLAETEYHKFRVTQDKEYLSDFDQFVKGVNDKKEMTSITGFKITKPK